MRRTAFATAVCSVSLLANSFAMAQSNSQETVEAHLRRGQQALRESHPQAAAEEFKAALAIDPKNVEANTNLGILDFGRGDCQTAAKEFRTALAADHSLAQAQGLLGICEKRAGEPAAKASLESAWAHVKEPKLRIEVGVELADLYYQQGDLDHALPILRELLAAHPENVDILYFAERVYTEMADDALNKIALLAPGSARMQELIAEHLVNSGDLKAATDHYRQALKLDPYLPGAHFELAEAILEASPTLADAQNEAEQELLLAQKIDGDGPKVECKLGRIAFLKSDMDAALAHYQRAYALNPANVEADLGIARILMSRSQNKEALPYLQKAIDADPLNAEAHYRLAMAYKALQRKEESQQELRIFQEIKESKAKVIDLYRQMNHAGPQQEVVPAETP